MSVDADAVAVALTRLADLGDAVQCNVALGFAEDARIVGHRLRLNETDGFRRHFVGDALLFHISTKLSNHPSLQDL